MSLFSNWNIFHRKRLIEISVFLFHLKRNAQRFYLDVRATRHARSLHNRPILASLQEARVRLSSIVIETTHTYMKIDKDTATKCDFTFVYSSKKAYTHVFQLLVRKCSGIRIGRNRGFITSWKTPSDFG